MEGKSYLAYVNVKAFSFDYTDFNFDPKYVFELEVDNEERIPKYILHISKRQEPIQPEGFWGNNISTVNVLVGQNGAGKTSFFRLMTNHIGAGLTAMNGERIIYIVNYEGIYVVFNSQYSTVQIVKVDNSSDINIITEDEYNDILRIQNRLEPPYGNRRFWKNMIFFSNHFGTLSIRNNNYVINVSKDEEIRDVINHLESIDELKIEPLPNIYKRYRDLKIFNYSTDKDFQLMAGKCKVSLLNLLKFSIRDNNVYDKFYDKNKFPYHKNWIGVHRYEIYTHDDILYEYEAAINKFSVYLMAYLMYEGMVDEDTFQKFLSDLSDTCDKTGIELALENIQTNKRKELAIWIDCLCFINEKSNDRDKKFIINWQNEEEFYCRWDDKDIGLIKNLLSMNINNLFFSCELAGSERNGFYSSGEDSKLSIFLALYEALRKIETGEGHASNNNLIILLDEIDAYFHPKYQINIVSELLDIIAKGFQKYNVQIILASNTPLELSDFPSSSIIYLEDGHASKSQNDIETFGSNVCRLLKNQFYINTTMGAFAKRKIDEVIKFLSDESCQNVSLEEVAYIISIIGEPIIKKKLQEMYDKKYPNEKQENREIDYYKEKIQDLQRKILNSKEIDNDMLSSLEEELKKLSNTIRDVKGEE